MDRNNSIRILIRIQSTWRLHILFVWSKLSGSDHAQGECLLPPPRFCSTWSCHSTAFITPGASFSFSRFLPNLRQLSSWAEALKWKEDDVCGGSRRAGSALLCLYSSALRGMDRNLRKWRESGSEFSPKGWACVSWRGWAQRWTISVPIGSCCLPAPLSPSPSRWLLTWRGLMNPRAAAWLKDQSDTNWAIRLSYLVTRIKTLKGRKLLWVLGSWLPWCFVE